MKLTDAFKELAQYHDQHVEMTTPGGNTTTLIDAWIEEILAEDNGYEDPNDYDISTIEGIYYRTTTGKNGGIAYGLK